MKRTIVALVLLFSVAVVWSQPADVLGWGATRWGMSVKQVAAAVGAPWKSAVNLKESLGGPEDLYQVEFLESSWIPKSLFWFSKTGNLKEVWIFPGSLDDALLFLVARFGAPIATLDEAASPYTIRHFYWTFKSTLIELVEDANLYYDAEKLIEDIDPRREGIARIDKRPIPSKYIIYFKPNLTPPWLP